MVRLSARTFLQGGLKVLFELIFADANTGTAVMAEPAGFNQTVYGRDTAIEPLGDLGNAQHLKPLSSISGFRREILVSDPIDQLGQRQFRPEKCAFIRVRSA